MVNDGQICDKQKSTKMEKVSGEKKDERCSGEEVKELTNHGTGGFVMSRKREHPGSWKNGQWPIILGTS
jgi:hypothetical protein